MYEEGRKEEQEQKRLITVCDKCKMASCWQGIFMCDENRSAGTIELPISELKILKLENSFYWDNIL